MDWMARVGSINVNIRKLYFLSKGTGTPPEEEIDLRKEYEELHRATLGLSIPPEYPEAIQAVERFDSTIAEAVGLLSSSPTTEELEVAMNLLRPLMQEANTLSTLLNDIAF